MSFFSRKKDEATALMIKAAIDQFLTDDAIEKLKKSILDFVDKKQIEQGADLLLVAQKVPDCADIAIQVYAKKEGNKKDLIETIYLSQLSTETVKKLLA